jgi:signal transduction histidine kinase
MGRLFWKFFFFFWVAQVVTSFGVGLAIWALRPEPVQMQMQDVPPPMPPLAGQGALAPPMPGTMPPRHHRHRGILPPPIPIIAGSIVSLIFAALLAWYFSRPIRAMRTAFDAVANGKLDTRIGLSMGGRKDELADLGHDFDRMASRLQGLMEAQRRLLHDISHELRSPLARLQAATDLMQQQPERAAELISRLERDTGRIDSLVGELLTLARLDSGMTERMNESVDVQEMITYIVQDARFEADAKQCSVDVSLPEYIDIKGNHELLFRAIENVVRNAVLHSPPGKRVSIVVNKNSEGNWLITVADEGTGVPVAEIEKIFEPFFRGKTDEGSPGYGLGLAITRRVVQAHGGAVTAANRKEGGLAVMILLPAAG